MDRRVARPDPTGAQWATGAPVLRQRPRVPHFRRDRIHNWRRPESARHARAGPARFPPIRLPGVCRGRERPRDGQCPPAHRRRRQAPRWDRHRLEPRGQAGRVVDAMDRVPSRSAELAVDVDRPRHLSRARPSVRPGGGSGPIDLAPPTEAERMSDPNDIEPMRCQGFDGDAQAEIARQRRRPRRTVWRSWSRSSRDADHEKFLM